MNTRMPRQWQPIRDGVAAHYCTAVVRVLRCTDIDLPRHKHAAYVVQERHYPGLWTSVRTLYNAHAAIADAVQRARRMEAG